MLDRVLGWTRTISEERLRVCIRLLYSLDLHEVQHTRARRRQLTPPAHASPPRLESLDHTSSSAERTGHAHFSAKSSLSPTPCNSLLMLVQLKKPPSISSVSSTPNPPLILMISIKLSELLLEETSNSKTSGSNIPAEKSKSSKTSTSRSKPPRKSLW